MLHNNLGKTKGIKMGRLKKTVGELGPEEAQEMTKGILLFIVSFGTILAVAWGLDKVFSSK